MYAGLHRTIWLVYLGCVRECRAGADRPVNGSFLLSFDLAGRMEGWNVMAWYRMQCRLGVGSDMLMVGYLYDTLF